MSIDREREEEIFDVAREIAAADEQAAYLARVCGGNTELRERIEGMLKADAAAGDFFNCPEGPRPAILLEGSSLAGSIEKAGERIERYKLLQQIGEGGMGVVYMAEQEEPVRRTVALKIIKLGMDTRQVVARFEAERQALALMDHPHIAKVLEAGATDSGRPYFVMELVRGVPITEFCDKNCLPPHQRLEVFIQVCQAVQHAHQKGVIHRDLKPSNILVTLNDGVPWPMIIDFGVAKATNQRLTEKTLFTHFAQMIGTPAYMSPEQAEMSKLDVDTRTDIYALGVLLYELLTGAPPFPTQELLSLGYQEMQRTIAEREPPRPSTRLSTMDNEERSVVARNRNTEASALAKLFRGDLDWIAMKCLEKDRTRRYETANELALDVQRHLQNEPVTACPPSRLYRFQKAYRRNRLAFLTAGAIFALLFLAMAAIWASSQRERRARLQESLQRQRAQASEQMAKEAEARAIELRQRAEASELTAQQRAYAADINLAQQALADGDLGRAQRLLEPYADGDLRGWEWRYLWQQTRSDALCTLFTVPGSAFAVNSSPDGRWLAVKADDGGFASLIHVWDREAGATIAKLPAVDSSARPLFGPVTSILAYNGELESPTNTYGVLLWDPKTQRRIAELPAGKLASFSFTADEKLMVTCDYKYNVLCWEIPRGRLISSNSFRQLQGSANATLMTRDGATLILVCSNGPCAFDLRTGNELWCCATNRRFELALSSDERILAGGPAYSGKPIILYEAATGRVLGRLEGHRSWVKGIVFWPDGRRLASASYDQTIRIWDIRDPAKVPPPRILRGHKQAIWGLTLLPDGKTLVSASKDGEVCAWDSDRNLLESPSESLEVMNLSYWSFAPDNRSMLAPDFEGREMVEWTLKGGDQKHTSMAFPPGITDACFSRDGSELAVGSTNGPLQIWELPAKTLRTQFFASTSGVVVPLQFHREKRELAVRVLQENDSDLFEIWETTSGRRLLSRAIPTNILPALVGNREDVFHQFQLAPDLTQVFAHTRSNGNLKQQRALLWRPADDRRLDLGLFDEAAWEGVAFSPDEGLVAACAYSGWTWVWNARTGQAVAKFAAFLDGAGGITFSPDGKRLVVGGGGDGVCKVWEVEGWRELVSLPTTGRWVEEVRFSPDGNLLGAGSDVRHLQYWRASWEEIAKGQ